MTISENQIILDLSNKDLANNEDIEIIKLINQPLYNSIILSNNNIENMEINILPNNYRDIDLSKNNIHNMTLENVNRQKVNLSFNKITEIIIRNSEFEILNLSNNNIKEITIIDSKIDFLDLNTNSIEVVTFINTTVFELDLSINKIKYFDFYPKSIESMSLFANKLQGISNMPDSIKKIDLSSNKLTELTYVSKNLNGLDISNNLIKTFDPSILPKTIDYFDISHNKIDDTSIFNSLEIVNCTYDKKNYKTMNNSDSDSVKKTTKKNITSIEISDDSSEWDDLDDEIDEDALPDIESDESSVTTEEEVDLMSYIKKINGEKSIDIYQKETHIEHQDNDDGNISDDEISKILKEYKQQIKEDETKDDQRKNNLIKFLDEKMDSSSIDELPKYENFHLQWNIVI